MGEIPRSTFQFDFDFERKILAEAEKDSQNWSRLGLENLPSKALESTPSMVYFLNVIYDFKYDSCSAFFQRQLIRLVLF